MKNTLNYVPHFEEEIPWDIETFLRSTWELVLNRGNLFYTFGNFFRRRLLLDTMQLIRTDENLRISRTTFGFYST